MQESAQDRGSGASSKLIFVAASDVHVFLTSVRAAFGELWLKENQYSGVYAVAMHLFIHARSFTKTFRQLLTSVEAATMRTMSSKT